MFEPWCTDEAAIGRRLVGRLYQLVEVPETVYMTYRVVAHVMFDTQHSVITPCCADILLLKLGSLHVMSKIFSPTPVIFMLCGHSISAII